MGMMLSDGEVLNQSTASRRDQWETCDKLSSRLAFLLLILLPQFGRSAFLSPLLGRLFVQGKLEGCKQQLVLVPFDRKTFQEEIGMSKVIEVEVA